MGLETILIDGLAGLDPFYVMIAIAFLPLGECRVSIPYGIGMGISPYVVFLVSFIANIIAIPIIFYFLNIEFVMRIVNRLMGEKLSRKIEKNREKFEKYEELALFGFVAIPMVGTGAWTGTLIAHVLKLDRKKSFFVISAGVLAASAAVFLGSMGVGLALGIL